MKSAFWTLFDRMLCVFMALVMSQVPHCMDMYTIRLSGHLKEAARIVNQYTQAAQGFGLSLDGYIAKFMALKDPQIHVQGVIMQNAVDRLGLLSNGYTHITQAQWYQKPFVFLRYMDVEVLQGTLENYSFGVNFTIQTLVWMVIGVLLAIGISRFLGFCYRRLRFRGERSGQ